MSARLDRILNRIWLGISGALVIVLAFYMGAVVGVRRWPYDVERTVVFTPEVAPGGNFRMGRQINYQDDCELEYDRRLQSLTPDARGALRRDILPDINFKSPPWDLDQKLWVIDEPIPADFPCGPAMIVDSPSAACNWFQRLFWRQKRPDAITKFEVSCPRQAG